MYDLFKERGEEIMVSKKKPKKSKRSLGIKKEKKVVLLHYMQCNIKEEITVMW